MMSLFQPSYLYNSLLLSLLTIQSLYWPCTATPISSTNSKPNDVVYNAGPVQRGDTFLLHPRAQDDWPRLANKVRTNQKVRDKLNGIGECEARDLLGVNYWREELGEGRDIQTLQDIFYTHGMGTYVKQWVTSKEKPPNERANWAYMTWERITWILDPQYDQMPELETALRDVLQGTSYYSQFVASWFSDTEMKNLAQAYAELCSGDVYVLVPDDINPDSDINGWDIYTAWGGWEFPALTRNPSVESIKRVDPRSGEEPRTIWERKRGDPVTAQEPKGFLDDTPITWDFFTERSKSRADNGWLPLEIQFELYM